MAGGDRDLHPPLSIHAISSSSKIRARSPSKASTAAWRANTLGFTTAGKIRPPHGRSILQRRKRQVRPQEIQVPRRGK